MNTDTKEISQETMDFIEGIEDLSAEEKAGYIAMIKNGDDPVEVLDKIEDSIQEKVAKEFSEADIDVTEDPEFQPAYKEMANDFKLAEEELDESMAKLDSEANEIEKETIQSADNLKIEAIKANISGKDA
jgi:hypothetical protein